MAILDLSGVIQSGWGTGDWKVAGTRSLARPRHRSADIRVGGSRGHSCPQPPIRPSPV